jgi:hypothetical protein
VDVTDAVYHERDISDIQAVLRWFAAQGHPEAYRLRGHLMVWAGQHWRIRKSYDMSVINLIYAVEIDDPDLWTQFRETWG